MSSGSLTFAMARLQVTVNGTSSQSFARLTSTLWRNENPLRASRPRIDSAAASHAARGQRARMGEDECLADGHALRAGARDGHRRPADETEVHRQDPDAVLPILDARRKTVQT